MTRGRQFHDSIISLAHHEHLLPAIPTMEDKQSLVEEVESADGFPKTIQKEGNLSQAI
jgi:hypothetical protein